MRRALTVMVLVLTACSSNASPSDAASDAPIADAPSDAPSADAADAGPTDAGACTLTKPYSSKNATCNACAQAHCCAAINACYADKDCDDGYVNCILACALLPGDAGDAGVASCLADCGAQYPTGKVEYQAAIGCADTACAVECK